MGDQESHRQSGKPAHGEREGLAAGLVRPWRVVHGNQQRAARGEDPDSGQDGHRHALCVGRLFRRAVWQFGAVGDPQCPSQGGSMGFCQAHIDRCQVGP